MHLQANQWPFCLFSMDSCPSTSFANLRFSFLLSGWLLRKCSLSAALLVAPLCLLPATGQRRHFWQGWQHLACATCVRHVKLQGAHVHVLTLRACQF